MNKEQSAKHYTLLLKDISQFEVDFVIPRVGSDIPLGIDPFLMFKSRDTQLSTLHSLMLNAFNYGVKLVADRKFKEAENYFLFPEVSEIGLGYSKTDKQGSGVGEYLGSLIINSLINSPDFLKRGIKHIEEMQLICVGIGRDRVSDTAANIIKLPLIEYTQSQCKLWGIKLYKDVPVENVFDTETGKWFDSYFELPLSPFNQKSMIFVPRRIVRTLPWINYDDYFQTEFSAFLKSKSGLKKLKRTSNKNSELSNEEKKEIVSLTQKDVERVDRYIAKKEEMAINAQPSDNYINENQICPESDSIKERLQNIVPGTKDATAYQHLILETLNFLFNPELIRGEPEVRTIDGTERRDIIFTNDSDQTFWSYLRQEHSSFLIMFEIKNTTDIDNNYLNQTATYLGDRLGRLGFIVTRNPLQEAQQRKAFSIYNDSTPRKVILNLSDSDMKIMLDMKCKGNNPMRHIQELYRSFKTSVQ